jgi:hypothetical protein
MTRPTPDRDLQTLYTALAPVLARASVGDYDSEIEIDPANDRRVNELLVGVQVLLDVIAEQQATLSQQSAHRATLIDEVLQSGSES